ncbi:MAG: hypothetical protein BGO87_02820 [Flavobacteriia bacterium 40-80]|nr:MAG: hypothetical protein BGO87_02820 [Flavobacteriia bacterium 40-80]
MKKLYSFFIGIGFFCSAFGQHKEAFQTAYKNHPYIRTGLLEAVAFTNTHIRDIKSEEQESCSGMPLPYGIMGIFDQGKNYFRENGLKIAEISGISVEIQKQNIYSQVLAYAKAYNQLMEQFTGGDVLLALNPRYIRAVLAELSEIPEDGLVNRYALDLQVYEILKNLDDEGLSERYGFDRVKISFSEVFGEKNALLLSSPKVILTETGIKNPVNTMEMYQPLPYVSPVNFQQKSVDYAPSTWNAAPSCNYSSRSGTAVSAVTIHTIQGTYAGAISWSQNCSSGVSYHYVIRSSDGQITQMVLESNKAWHVGSENPYTIGYEHEGYVNDASWYTNSMYNASAALTIDVCNSGYGISPLRTYHKESTTGINVQGGCTKIKGHQHYSNQTHTDPGINWDWEKYYSLINPQTTATTYTSTSGTFYDSGGASGNYGNDERNFWLISPANATSVTLNFTSFNIENTYDFILVYNGNTTSSPLLGKFTGTTAPAALTASSGKILIEFRSDCATVSSGWTASWSSTVSSGGSLYTSIPVDNSWKTTNFSVSMTDVSANGIQASFYLPGMKAAGQNGWKARQPLGFLNEDFQDDRSNWTDESDTWLISSGVLKNSSSSNTNTNVYSSVLQSQYSSYLYHWKQKITSTGSNQRAGLHFFCSSTTGNRGNSYFVFFRESTNKVQIYKVTNDVYSLVQEDACTINSGANYDIKVLYSPSSGTIKVFVDNVLKSSWSDSSPILSGSYVSLRTGNCIAEFDDVRMYRSRAASVTINVGSLGHFNQNSVGGIRSGLLRSVILSSDDDWSAEAAQEYLVDYTAALAVVLQTKFSIEDVNLLVTNSFDFSDPESAVESVQLALGSSPEQSDIMQWTDVTQLKEWHYSQQREVNYNKIYATYIVTNGAGMEERFIVESGKTSVDFKDAVVFPNPALTAIQISGIPENTAVSISDATGRVIWSGVADSFELIPVDYLQKGIYHVRMNEEDGQTVRPFIKQ